MPFLSDLTPVARASVRSVQLTKKLAMGEFDRAEWGHACGFLGRRLRLRRLGVGVVVAGKWGESDEEDVLDEDGNSEGEQGLEPQQLQTPPPSPTSSDVTSSLTTGSWLSTIKPISRQEFEFMRRMQREWDVKVEGVDLEWVEQLMQIRGLEDLKVGVIRESGCGRGMVRNDGMRFWVAFGRSVEGGFREWVSGVMVG